MHERSLDMGSLRKACLATLVAVAAWVVLCGATAGDRAPPLAGARSAGGRVDLGQLRGRVVIVDFWASWCEPCRRSFPVLDSLSRRMESRGLTVVAVSVDDEASNVRRFVAELRPSFAIVHDQDHQIAERWAPDAMPTTFVIDRRGFVRAVFAGFRDGDAAALERAVLATLADST